mmetsp:Transcript_33156/g.75546  ORF Transcript_33156/g.75546 Transcript_33156/m.75546 type:complete len:255 (-) Transcript_33156:31-795(-)
MRPHVCANAWGQISSQSPASVASHKYSGHCKHSGHCEQILKPYRALSINAAAACLSDYQNGALMQMIALTNASVPAVLIPSLLCCPFLPSLQSLSGVALSWSCSTQKRNSFCDMLSVLPTSCFSSSADALQLPTASSTAAAARKTKNPPKAVSHRPAEPSQNSSEPPWQPPPKLSRCLWPTFIALTNQCVVARHILFLNDHASNLHGCDPWMLLEQRARPRVHSLSSSRVDSGAPFASPNLVGGDRQCQGPSLL